MTPKDFEASRDDFAQPFSGKDLATFRQVADSAVISEVALRLKLPSLCGSRSAPENVAF
jgi:hypothetical protein